MKLFFVNVWKYLAMFFAGVIAALVWAMKQVKPDQTTINAETYVGSNAPKIGKLKQRGEGNSQETVLALPAVSRKQIRQLRRAARKAKTVLSELAPIDKI